MATDQIIAIPIVNKVMSNIVKQIFNWEDRSESKFIYHFSEGSKDDKSLLGNKGALLCEMYRLGIPVPPGFVLSTNACTKFLKEGYKLSSSTIDEYAKAVHELERITKKGFMVFDAISGKGITPELPLLLSVRSGAVVSMPGMMSTVLNVGINDQVVDQLIVLSNNRPWALDTHRRFLQMFGQVVLGIDSKLYDDVLEMIKSESNVQHEHELSETNLENIVQEFKKITNAPDDPWIQLQMSIEAVFKSWNSPRARKYREFNDISHDLGTAVIVQTMVFGNLNDTSGSGVCFTRSPSTGVKEVYGEYLPNAQGEDVVSGVRTPLKLSELDLQMPQIYQQLLKFMTRLEVHFKDIQDIEFTVENSNLFILQTRNAKRSIRASVTSAVDMVHEGLITERDAIRRIDAKQLDFFLHQTVDPRYANEESEEGRDAIISKGLAASAGTATGKVIFTNEEAEEMNSRGVSCILCKQNTSADDIVGLKMAKGVLTNRGGLTSHAAVVMRGMGKPAVTGVQSLVIDAEKEQIRNQNGEVCLNKGDMVTIDGSTGLIYRGEVPTISSSQSEDFQTILRWAGKYKRMQVLANADTPDEVQRALELGAEGVGLCRTEHMFFKSDRINLFRHMILADDDNDRRKVLDQILPFQQQDFVEMFRLLDNMEITVRLLDPPLHEFFPSPDMPNYESEVKSLAENLEIQQGHIMRRIESMQEVNPMLGFRGCRLSIIHPEIAEMQVKAVTEALYTVAREGIHPIVQIMVPFTISDHEIDWLYTRIRRKMKSGVAIGAMIETPRACIRADRIVSSAQVKFISFGTNDLTQLVMGMSRDDTQRFIPFYMSQHLLDSDPFQRIDVRGVGEFMRSACEKAKSADKHIKISVCGEHAGDPFSIGFFQSIGVDSVSCSSYRIPTAVLGAAQAEINRTQTSHSQIFNIY